MKRHTPTPDAIQEAVSTAFRTPVDLASRSRKKSTWIPKQAFIYLLRVRACMTVPAIAEHTGYNQDWIRLNIRNAMGTIRVDSDFAFRVWEAEKIILGITEKRIITH